MTDTDTQSDASPEPGSRRPLGSRNTAWARGLAEWAIKTGLTPNQISRAAVGFAALGIIPLAEAPASCNGFC